MLRHITVTTALKCITLILLLSGCVTKPIKTQPLSALNTAGAAEVDFVYYLPMSIMQVSYDEKASALSLKPVTTADREAGFAVDRPRRMGGRGQVVLATKKTGSGGTSSSVGLLSQVTLDADKESYTDEQLSKAVTAAISASAQLGKDDGKSKNADTSEGGGGSSQNEGSFIGIALTQDEQATPNSQNTSKPVVREIICGANAEGVFENISKTGGVSVPGRAPAACMIETQTAIIRVEPLNLLGTAWPSSDADKSCNQDDAVCFRQKISVPFKICTKTIPKKSKATEKNASLKMAVSYEPKTSTSSFCDAEGTDTKIVFKDVYDRSRNYSVALNGQQFVAVDTVLTFEDGALISFDDTRPGLVTSIAEAPFKLGTDILNSVVILLGAVFVN